MRPLVLLLAALAMLLALGPGSHAHATGMGSQMAIVSTHGDPGDCAPASALHGQTDRHDAGGCAKMSCCPGTICAFVGLPATAAFVTPVLTAGIVPSANATLLTGRDVAPPLDPPKSFA